MVGTKQNHELVLVLSITRSQHFTQGLKFTHPSSSAKQSLLLFYEADLSYLQLLDPAGILWTALTAANGFQRHTVESQRPRQASSLGFAFNSLLDRVQRPSTHSYCTTVKSSKHTLCIIHGCRHTRYKHKMTAQTLWVLWDSTLEDSRCASDM